MAVKYKLIVYSVHEGKDIEPPVIEGIVHWEPVKMTQAVDKLAGYHQIMILWRGIE